MTRQFRLYLTITKVAFRSLLANRLRTFLAMLGIIIGVCSVITMLAVGAGAQNAIISRIESMGANLLVVRPGMGGHRGVHSAESRTLTVEDAEAILNQIDGLDLVSPVVQGQGQFKALNKNKKASIIGAAATYFQIRNYEVEQGRGFTDREVDGRACVAVVGPNVIEELFEGKEALGQSVKIGGVRFKIIGVFKSKGDQGWFNPDDLAVIPFKTAMGRLPGYEALREIDLQVSKTANQDAVVSDVQALIRQRHRIQEGQEDDFNVRNQAEMVDTAASMTQTFTWLLGAVAAISLLVGGIGIMNIMLVSVTERTREIGVRKAIGARSRDILFQFLVEAIMVSGLGGAVGIIVGVGGATLIARFTSLVPEVQSYSIVMALSFSAGVGVFFGYYPASRAARLDPIDALQYE